MANIEYEDEEETLMKELSGEDDELDFGDDKKAKPVVNGADVKPSAKPVQKKASAKPEKEVPAQVQEASPSEETQESQEQPDISQYIMAKLNEHEERLTKMESDLYRSR